MGYIRVIVSLFAFYCFTFHSQLSADQLNIAVLTSEEQQMVAFNELATEFENINENRIRINIDFYSDISFKKHMQTWIDEGRYDLLYWQAGNRLKRLIDQHLIIPIDLLLPKKKLDAGIPKSILAQVTYNQQIYALPFAQYAWGFYYNRELFKRHNLSPPQDWTSFLALIQKLHDLEVQPFVQARQDLWPTLAWLDYFSLDIGGNEFRSELLAGGKVDEEMWGKMIGRFESLISNSSFYAPEHSWRWDEVIPTIYRERAAMTLMGQFIEASISDTIDRSIGFFPLPIKSQGNANSTIAPLEVFVVPSATKHKHNISQFLEHLSQPVVINRLATELGWLPIGLQISQQDIQSKRMFKGLRSIKDAEDLYQYFDREGEQNYSTAWATVLSEAISTSDTKQITLQNVEKNRAIISQKTLGEESSTLRLSTIAGVRGAYTSYKLLRPIYQSLGKNLVITRYANNEDTLASYGTTSDGELARAPGFLDKEDRLVRVPEPLLTANVYVVSRNIKICEKAKNGDFIGQKYTIGSASTLLLNWSKKTGAILERHPSASEMWLDYENNKIQSIVTLGSAVYQHENIVNLGCRQKVFSKPIYHFLTPEHAHMVTDVAERLREFKKTKAYTDLIKQVSGAKS